MWKRYRGFFILLAICAVLAIAIAIIQNTEDKGRKGRNIFDKGRDFFMDAERLEVETPEFKVVFEKSGEKWHMTEPIAYPADTTLVNNIADECDLAASKRTVRNITDKLLREHGLKEPRYTVRVTSGEETVEAGLGDATAAESDKIYAVVKGKNELYAIPDTILKNLYDDIYAYRSKNTIDYSATSTAKVHLSGMWNYRLSHEGDKWLLTDPFKARAGTIEAEGLCSDIYGLKVFEFVDDKPGDFAEYGLDKPQGVIIVVNDKDEESRLLIGDEAIVGPEGEQEKVYYARLEERNNVLAVRKDAVDALPSDATKLVDPDIANIEYPEFKLMKANLDGEEFELYMEDDELLFREEEHLGADGGAMDDLYNYLNDLQAGEIHVLDDVKDKAGLDGSWVLDINPGDTALSSHLRLEIGAFDEEAGGHYVRRNEEGVALLVARDKLEKLLELSRFSFYERKHELFDVEQVTYVSFIQEGKARSFSKKEGEWVCDTRPDATVDTDVLEAALDKWHKFFALATMKHKPGEKTIDPENPRAKLTVSFTTENEEGEKSGKTVTLLFGSDYEDGDDKGVYCWIKGKKYMLAAPNEVYSQFAETFLIGGNAQDGQGEDAKDAEDEGAEDEPEGAE
ncbi:MAG: DUF4340 domain-containing protein [Planctomycetota bacterium]|nr:DUF4340 domain-containing protein [Planctomycetota bacterium]